MIRSTPSRPALKTAAVVGVFGALALAGCSPEGNSATVEEPSDQSTAAADPSPSAAETSAAQESEATSESGYADGSYTAEGSYQTPETTETISVSIELEDGIITSVDVTGDPQARESERYQGEFIGGIADVVVGKSIDEIQVDKVAGSSLTSGGFNEAIEEIKSQAAA